MSLIASDAFVDTPGATVNGHTANIGGVWQGPVVTGSLGGGVISPSGDVRNRGSLPDAAALYGLNVTPATADCIVQADLRVYTVTGFNSPAIVSRLNTLSTGAAYNCWMAYYNGSAGEWQITPFQGGSPLSSHFSGAYPVTPGGIYTFAMEHVGNLHTLTVNGVVVISVTDTNVATTGFPGLNFFNSRTSFTDTTDYHLENFAFYDFNNPAAVFEVYFAGALDSENLSTVNYGNPTPIILSNPQSGYEYIVDVAAVDLADFLSGNMGNVKLRRAGASGGFSGNVVVRGIELYFDTTE